MFLSWVPLQFKEKVNLSHIFVQVMFLPTFITFCRLLITLNQSGTLKGGKLDIFYSTKVFVETQYVFQYLKHVFNKRFSELCFNFHANINNSRCFLL